MGLRTLKVLLVEDNPADEILSREIILSARPEANIVVIEDGEKAIIAVEHWSKLDLPDIVFLDLNLPRINGHEVLEHIKRKDPQIPVIILTGSTSEKDKRKAWKNNILDYIIKPIGMKEMEETISLVRSHFEPICS